eukprot:m.208042 g.208042  ORF g.208042 m.208042 type:complete len:408 (+) comp25416_c1_seq1:4546-5769(+)
MIYKTLIVSLPLLPRGRQGAASRPIGGNVEFFVKLRGLRPALEGRHNHLRESHLTVVSVGRICDGSNKERDARNKRGLLEWRVQSPEADALRNVPWLVEACAIRAARNEIGPLTKVWLFPADQITTSAATILNAAQLARLVRPNLKREAGGGMAVVVGCDKVEVRASRDDRAVDLVFALFHGSSGSALWNIVFSRRTTNAPRIVGCCDVVCRVVLLEVQPILEVVDERLVLPWDLLVRVEKVPLVVTGRKAADICANVARGVAILEEGLGAIIQIAPQREANGLAGREILECASSLAKRCRRNRAHARRLRGRRPERHARGPLGQMVRKCRCGAHCCDNVELKLQWVKRVMLRSDADESPRHHDGTNRARHTRAHDGDTRVDLDTGFVLAHDVLSDGSCPVDYNGVR